MESDVFQEAYYSVGLRADGKLEALTTMVRELYQRTVLPPSIDRTVSKLMQREEKGSTAIGRGFAIPHVECDVRRLMVGFFLATHGMDFGSLDNKPVYLLVPVLAPTECTRSLLRTLVRATRLFRKLESADRLGRKAKTDADLRRIVAEATAASEDLVSRPGDTQVAEGDSPSSSGLDIFVSSELGLHAKPCNDVCLIARCFDCRISIASEGVVADATSPHELLCLAISGGEHMVTLHAEGPDASEAIRILADVLTRLDDADYMIRAERDIIRHNIERIAGRKAPLSLL